MLLKFLFPFHTVHLPFSEYEPLYEVLSTFVSTVPLVTYAMPDDFQGW